MSAVELEVAPVEDVDDRATPAHIFDPLHAKYDFTIDVAASPENAKLLRYYTRETNGLIRPWAGERVWCNPPYSDIPSWVRKAVQETANGCPLVVLLLPANRTEQKWWHELIEPHRDRPGSGIATQFVQRRIAFGAPEPPPGQLKKNENRPKNGSVLVIVTPKGAEPKVEGTLPLLDLADEEE